MAKKSAISGEYIITIEDNDSVRVCQIFDNVKESLREAAKSVGFKFDPKWNTRQFGANLVKQYGDGHTASVGEYTIVKNDSGSIDTYRVFGNTIAVLRQIAAAVGLRAKPNWNTRTFGAKLVDFINGTYVDNDEIVDDGLVALPTMTTHELQEAFEKMYGGHLRIKKGVKRCDKQSDSDGLNVPLSEIGLKEKTVFSGEQTVGDFQKQAKEAGMTLLVATNDDWVTVLEDFALDFVGQIPNGATKDSMRAILDR